MTEKNVGISSCRVVATIMILLCHVIKYYSFIPGHQNLSQFFNVGVYIFIIISGYLYGMRKEKQIAISKFYMGRIQKIVIPVIVWELSVYWFDANSEISNLLSVVFSVQGGKWISDKIPIADGGGMMAHTWFVTIILICYLFVPLLNKMAKTQKNYIKTIIVLSIFTLILSLLSINIYYFVTFIISYYYAGSQLDRKNHKKIILIIVMCSSIIVRLLGRKLFDNSYLYSITIVGVVQTILAFSMFIFIKDLVASNKLLTKIASSKPINWLDKNSYYIYIVHYGIIPLIYIYFPLQLASILFCLATLVLTIILSSIDRLISYLICKIWKKEGASC